MLSGDNELSVIESYDLLLVEPLLYIHTYLYFLSSYSLLLLLHTNSVDDQANEPWELFSTLGKSSSYVEHSFEYSWWNSRFREPRSKRWESVCFYSLVSKKPTLNVSDLFILSLTLFRGSNTQRGGNRYITTGRTWSSILSRCFTDDGHSVES